MGERLHVSDATWLKLSSETLNGMMVATLLATAASLFLISSGMHETAVIPIVFAIGMMTIGFALVKLFRALRSESTPPIA